MQISARHVQACPIRVFLIDDHRVVLWGLGKLIESARPNMELVGSASCGPDALAAVTRLRPDVVLLDMDLGGESGMQLISRLRDHSTVVILTGMRDDALRERAMLEGALGVIHKSEPAEVILKAIVHVHGGETWLDRGTMGRVFRTLSEGRRQADAAGGRHATLTAAERRIIEAVINHRSAPNKTIAHAINISEHTLRNHLSSIYAKLGVRRRLDLVLYAMENKPSRLHS